MIKTCIKTKLNYKSDRNPMTCIDFTSKRSKCWVTSQNIQNNAKLQNRSNYNELHRLDVKTIKTKLNYKSDRNPMTCIDLRQNDKNVERRKTLKTTQNYKTNQITMNCIDWMSKRSKQRKTTKVIKLQWLASIICQNDQNNVKSNQITMTCTSKRSKQRKTTKPIKLHWIASIVW